MSDNTDKLLDTLIVQIGDLTKSVDKLVMIDAVRVEKEKHQEEKNEKVDSFIDESRPIIARAKLTQEMWDKAKGPLLVFFIIGFLTMAGVNFAG